MAGRLMAAAELSDRDRAIIEFERLRRGSAGAKESAIFDQFGMTLTRYTPRSSTS